MQEDWRSIGGALEDRRRIGRGIIEKELWGRGHGGGIMEVSWRNQGGIREREEDAWRRNPWEASGKLLGGIWEGSRRASDGSGIQKIAPRSNRIQMFPENLDLMMCL